MSLNRLELDTISRGMWAAKKLLDELQPVLSQLTISYDSVGGVKETVTQAELDEVEAYSGLTKAQLDDGMYALTAVLREDLVTTYAQLTQLASRA